MVDYRTGDMVIPAINETSEALGSVVAHFAHCARTGATPLTDGRAGLRILDVLEAAAGIANDPFLRSQARVSRQPSQAAELYLYCTIL